MIRKKKTETQKIKMGRKPKRTVMKTEMTIKAVMIAVKERTRMKKKELDPMIPNQETIKNVMTVIWIRKVKRMQKKIVRVVKKTLINQMIKIMLVMETKIEIEMIIAKMAQNRVMNLRQTKVKTLKELKMTHQTLQWAMKEVEKTKSQLLNLTLPLKIVQKTKGVIVHPIPPTKTLTIKLTMTQTNLVQPETDNQNQSQPSPRILPLMALLS
jgi:hypothetical protein